jgi:hypothetical protein
MYICILAFSLVFNGNMHWMFVLLINIASTYTNVFPDENLQMLVFANDEPITVTTLPGPMTVWSIDVIVGVNVVAVGDEVIVEVDVGVWVGVDVSVGTAANVSVGVGDKVGVGVGVYVRIGVDVSLDVVLVGVGVAVNVVVGVGV